MKRDTAKTIFRTVVVAGAMLGAGGCSKKSTTPSAVPANTSPAADPAMKTPDGSTNDTATTPDPCAGANADPCAGGERPRGTDDDGGGGTGRGFVLS